jgi:peroxiredoxin
MLQKILSNIFLIGTLMIFGCEHKITPEKLFDLSKDKYLNSEYYTYRTVLIWPHPFLDEIDTFRYHLQFEKFPNQYFRYNIIGSGEKYDLVYIDNVMNDYFHLDSTAIVYTEDQMEKERDSFKSSMFLVFGPINIFEMPDFEYQKDTSISGKIMRKYLRVDMDTLIEDIKVYKELHIYINPANLEVPLIRSMLYNNGKKQQFIDAWFENYDFEDRSPGLTYDLPVGYTTKVRGEEKIKRTLLSKGNKAPDFELQNMEGNTVSLADFKGKRVFLDFSIINCGWCKVALDEFSKPEFEFAEDVVPLYINPVDNKERLESYLSKTDIPFPVLTDAQKIGEAYGVSGYPSFFIIGKDGQIEESFAGYNPELIEKLRKSK